MKLLRCGIALVLLFLALTSARGIVYSQTQIEQPLAGITVKTDSSVIVSGRASPEKDMVLYIEGEEFARFISTKDGKWSYTIPSLAEESYTIDVASLNDDNSEESRATTTFRVEPIQTSFLDKLVESGMITTIIIFIGILMIELTIWAYVDYRHHKRPLQTIDPNVKYSFWHHLHVVSLPLIKYRLSISIDKRISNRSTNIRKY